MHQFVVLNSVNADKLSQKKTKYTKINMLQVEEFSIYQQYVAFVVYLKSISFQPVVRAAVAKFPLCR